LDLDDVESKDHLGVSLDVTKYVGKNNFHINFYSIFMWF
jgi:hypothetical protein